MKSTLEHYVYGGKAHATGMTVVKHTAYDVTKSGIFWHNDPLFDILSTFHQQAAPIPISPV